MNEKQTHILGAKLDLISKKDMRKLIMNWLKQRQLKHIITLNPEICLQAEQDKDFLKIIKHSSLSVDDGIGLQIASLIIGETVPQRITGREVLHEVCVASLKQNKSIYLLGGKENIADKAAHKLKALYPGIRIVGAEQGRDKDDFCFDMPEITNRINQSKADIVLVAFGAPKQEKWIHANQKTLKTVKIAIGIGGLFDYLADEVLNPPKVIEKIGLEWLFRLITRPKRIGRIFNATFTFLWHVIKWRLRMNFSYRKNVLGAILSNNDELLLVSPAWSSTIKWQFPQGGIDKKEKPENAILREMSEELGTDQFEILHKEKGVYTYTWNHWYRALKGYKGQKQDLFILKYLGENIDIDLETEGELSAWKWVTSKNLIDQLSPIRRKSGQIVLDTLNNIQ